MQLVALVGKVSLTMGSWLALAGTCCAVLWVCSFIQCREDPTQTRTPTATLSLIVPCESNGQHLEPDVVDNASDSDRIDSYPVGRRRASESAAAVAGWIDDLSRKDKSRRVEAKAQLRKALESDPRGPVAVLLRHANVQSEDREARHVCRELLFAQQLAKREDARRFAARKLGIRTVRIISIPYLPHVLDDCFFFAVFDPTSRTAGPTAKAYISVTFATAKAESTVRSHQGGVSPEVLSQLAAASHFRVRSAEDALDLAVLSAGLVSTLHADGWCLVPQPDTVAPCAMWPDGRTLPEDLQQEAVEAHARSTASKNGYLVSFTTWTAVGGRVTNWNIEVSGDGTVKVQHRQVIGGAFGIGFS